MNFGELITIQVLDQQDSTDKSKSHTRYSDEIRLLSCVQAGDIDRLIKEYNRTNLPIIAGKLSNDQVNQNRYFAVSAITLVTRYAIQGGISESLAYQISDDAIMQIDTMTTQEEIVNCMVNMIVKITKLVAQSKAQPIKSPHVRKCILYINDNIGKKITVTSLSNLCNISADYLSQIFKEEMNENLSTYIIRQKLEKAKDMIVQNVPISTVWEKLGFSSHSYFTTSFKKLYNMTPSEYSSLVK